ncbi:exonuclease domain-containing protein [Acetobacter malorum]|uniref:3'-5' exonuclease n=1 Tax=Acetobacter malorum TaxID=178901 RepID=UPI0039E7F5B7
MGNGHGNKKGFWQVYFIIGFFIFSIIFNYSLAWSTNRNRLGWALMGILLPIASGMVLWALPRREHPAFHNFIEKAQAPHLDDSGEKLASQVQHDAAGLSYSKADEPAAMSKPVISRPEENNDNNAMIPNIQGNISPIGKELSSEKNNEKPVSTGNFSDSIFYIKGSKRPLFIDVETTGLHSNDAIVSIGMFLLYAEESQEKQKFRYVALHYIFDPCKKSHPIAEKVHGYDDWTLRHQELFEQKTHDILEFIKESDLIVAHNIKFDMRFLRNAFAQAGIDIGQLDTACTMEMRGGSLSACAKGIGISRQNATHDAAEDAAMCMCLYLASVSNINVSKLYPRLNIPPVTNYIPPPPRPEGPLPRRNNVKKRKEILANIDMT